jgi:hypothetical protein
VRAKASSKTGESCSVTVARADNKRRLTLALEEKGNAIAGKVDSGEVEINKYADVKEEKNKVVE